MKDWSLSQAYLDRLLENQNKKHARPRAASVENWNIENCNGASSEETKELRVASVRRTPSGKTKQCESCLKTNHTTQQQFLRANAANTLAQSKQS